METAWFFLLSQTVNAKLKPSSATDFKELTP
jgi:hypothetical protein